MHSLEEIKKMNKEAVKISVTEKRYQELKLLLNNVELTELNCLRIKEFLEEL